MIFTAVAVVLVDLFWHRYSFLFQLNLRVIRLFYDMNKTTFRIQLFSRSLFFSDEHFLENCNTYYSATPVSY